LLFWGKMMYICGIAASCGGFKTYTMLDKVKMMELEKFQKGLNRQPNKAHVQTMQGFEYLAISYVQAKLDELYFGIWKVENFRWQVIVNEIIGSVDLHVYHPILETWIVRTGAAANAIRQKKDSDSTDIGAKIKTALEQDFAKLKTECIKNAAKDLGVIFGRDLNRKNETVAEYTPIVTPAVSKHYESRILEVATMEQLNVIAGEKEALSSNEIMKMIMNRKKQLETICLP
jgi:hypothetical protein